VSVERVAAHLTATRITELTGPRDGEIAGDYRAWHADLTRQLGERFTGLKPVELFVACTANAKSELLVADGVRTIVHDEYLGRTLNRMTRFVIHDWPPNLVQSWAFERVATAAWARGDAAATRLGLGFAAHVGRTAKPPTPNPALDAVRQVFVTLQEFFVLAHEVAHSALGETAHESLEKHLRDELDAILRQSAAVQEDLTEVLAESMANDVAQAVARHLGMDEPPDDGFEQLKEFGRGGHDFDEGAWLRDHPYLYEEVACDLMATELTLEHFHEENSAIDTQTVLSAILMALHHLTSLEYLESLIGDHETGATLHATMVRKSVWRQMTRATYDVQCPSPLGEVYAQITQDHAKKVGDQVLFVVPVQWRKAHALLAEAEDNHLSPANAKALRDLIWALARPAEPSATSG
jgi:hypothetical protein